MSVSMWQPDLTGRPHGARLVVCAGSAIVSVVLLVAAVVLLATGHAGITLVLLPAVGILAGYATYVLETSLRNYQPADPDCALSPTR
jgi:hypothetical protein